MSTEADTAIGSGNGAVVGTAAIAAVRQKLTDKGIEFALAAWVDTVGRAKAKFVPIESVDKMLEGRGPLYG
ncbi:MAG: hypothetical protein QOD44_541, partial [Solirubrobacteraceae bacterium]|nr:hypothetical protein [Solirubrobacteraceae bacterium]